MLKLVILFSFTTVLYGWDWSNDDYVTGVVGKWISVTGSDCQNDVNGKCSSSKICCAPRVCWMDGVCREKIGEHYSPEGFEYITGKVGQYQRYDGCNNDRKRLGEACNKTSDCCFPLDCEGRINRICHGDTSIFDKFSAGWTLGRPRLL